jgi:inosine/xanthosine triphosphatase
VFYTIINNTPLRKDVMQRQEQPIFVDYVGVGTTNPAKLTAVMQAIHQRWPSATVHGVDVDSGVSFQPLTDEEAIVGAINRAQRALTMTDASLGIGVEGNTVELPQGMFSTAWVAVIDRTGQIGLGSSGRFCLPDSVAQAIRQGGELGPLMDLLTGEQNTKHKQGAVGILTGGLITRTAALETAVIFALARFISPQFYR